MNFKNNLPPYDLCIIGGGPAGIILTLEYIRLHPGNRVILIEYGYEGQPNRNALDDSIRLKNTINHHDPYECTNKGLGGTSQTWGGRCVMYDDIDFIDRPIVDGGCTWDTGLFEEVKAFMPAAARYFECGDPVFNITDIPAFKETRIADNFKEGIVIDSIVERWSMPTRFGKRYKKELLACASLTLLEGYEARDFAAPDANGIVEYLRIKNLRNGELEEIRAKNFVLAAGAQETTRLILRNTQLFKLLNCVPSSLGKYYQGHLFGKIASVVFTGDPKKTEFGFLKNSDGTYMRRRFQFTKKYLLDNNLLNTAIWLDNPLYYDPSHKNGAMSFMYLAMITPLLGKRLAPPAIAYSITKGQTKNIRKHIWNIIKDLPGSLTTPAVIFYKRYCIKRKLPGIFLYSPKNIYALYFHAEQTPVAQNRMELDPTTDTLVIHYSITDTDVNSVIQLHEALDQWLRDSHCGSLQYWYPKEELPETIRKICKDGIHQIGTTRIADSAAKGVVDSTLKIWGTKNVFVCSSSVFPTSGQANPTFFLGAFAVRLANHLN
jgi:hypothetical protein